MNPKTNSQADNSNLKNQDIDNSTSNREIELFTHKLMDAIGAALDAQKIAVEYLERATKNTSHPAEDTDAATEPDFSHRLFNSAEEMTSLEIAETITNMAARSRAVLGLIQSSLEGNLDVDRLYFSLMTVSMDVKDMAAVIETFERNQRPIDKEIIGFLPFYAVDLAVFPHLQEICQRAHHRLAKIMTQLAENKGQRLVTERIGQIIEKIEMEIIAIDQAVPILSAISAAAEQATKTKRKQPA